MEQSGYNLWQLFAGIGLFLFGMQLMEQAISHLAGRSFKVFLRDQTRHPLRAVIAGLLVTAALQSSSIVNLLILAFVGARILTMRNALAIILGSNLGSTIYNWIVVYLGFKFDIQSFAFPIMALAAIGLIFFQHQKKIMHWTRLSFGLSLLFLGLANIKSGVEILVASTDLSAINEYGNIVFVIAGFILTAIVQSSSTMVVIALSALNAGAIQFDAAACIVIGSESGTAVKTVLGAVGTVADKKRVGLGNMVMNVTASTVAFLFLGWIIYLITDLVGIRDQLVALVFFQSFINVVSIIIFFPFLRPFSRWLENLFGDTDVKMSLYLNKLLMNDHEEALKAIEKDGRRLIRNIISLNKLAIEIDTSPDNIPLSKDVLIPQATGKSYTEHYELVKQLNGEILDFCLELKNTKPDHAEEKRLENLILVLRHAMNSAKSVKDIRHNIKDYRDSADDLLHGIYIRIRKREEPFYTKLDELISEVTIDAFGDVADLLAESRNRHDENIQEIFSLASKNRLHDTQITTLINVYESIRLSHESLIAAVKALYSLDTPGELEE